MAAWAVRWCLGLVTIALPATTLAQESDAPPASSAREQALTLFQQSEVLYRSGNFRESAALLEQAYAIFPEPVLLYNLARAQEGLGDAASAVTTYERYLAADPEVADRETIEHHVQSLRDQLRSDKAAAEPVPAAPAREQRPSVETVPQPLRARAAAQERAISPAPWIVGGIGVAAAGTGLVLRLLAESRHDDAVAETSASAAESKQHDAETLAAAATITLIGGGIVTAAGVTWGLVELTSRGPASSSGALTLRVAPAAFEMSARF